MCVGWLVGCWLWVCMHVYRVAGCEEGGCECVPMCFGALVSQ